MTVNHSVASAIMTPILTPAGGMTVITQMGWALDDIILAGNTGIAGALLRKPPLAVILVARSTLLKEWEVVATGGLRSSLRPGVRASQGFARVKRLHCSRPCCDAFPIERVGAERLGNTIPQYKYGDVVNKQDHREMAMVDI